jgi:hypothetical protein
VPAHGVRFVLDRVTDSDEAVVYRGRVELEGGSAAVEVRVEPADNPGGWQARAEAPEAPEAYRSALERTAAAIAKTAVRSARHGGRPVPRRLTRWREL